MRAMLALLPLIPNLVVFAKADAQERGPWMAALSMTRKVIAVGECNAVSIDLRDAKGQEWPRGPNGTRVSMADFDLAVSAPSAHVAVGQYDGPNSLSLIHISEPTRRTP